MRKKHWLGVQSCPVQPTKHEEKGNLCIQEQRKVHTKLEKFHIEKSSQKNLALPKPMPSTQEKYPSRHVNSIVPHKRGDSNNWGRETKSCNIATLYCKMKSQKLKQKLENHGQEVGDLSKQQVPISWGSYFHVSINSIDSVIKTVLKRTKSECERLPRHTMITELTVEENLELFGSNQCTFHEDHARVYEPPILVLTR